MLLPLNGLISEFTNFRQEFHEFHLENIYLRMERSHRWASLLQVSQVITDSGNFSSRVFNNSWVTFSAKGKILTVAISETRKLGSAIVSIAFMATSFTTELSRTPSSFSSCSLSFSSFSSSAVLLPARTSLLFLNRRWKREFWNFFLFKMGDGSAVASITYSHRS